ncbi:ISxac3 transposase, partial [mine drainage metagenome]
MLGLILRQVIGWAMRDHADTDLVLQALLSAAWRRQTRTGRV